MSWKEICRLLEVLLTLPEEERDEYIDEHCGEDEAAGSRVRRLLARREALNEESQEDFMAQPIFDLNRPDPLIDKRIGPYRINRLIAEGGMSLVYEASRVDDFGQQVAFKVIKAGLAGGDFLMRFQNERQIQAKMDHPYIVRVLDGGTAPDGRPYLVMDYVVDGTPLDRWCVDNELGLRERIELFLEACEAVEYAHRRMIVHRDLKPGNILVTREGLPRLLDFGIAAALEPDPSLAEVRTVVGRGLMTPAYASPEQAAGERVAFGSDVYSLGVVLYRLLAGVSPYDVSGLADSELVALLQKGDHPLPSVAAPQRAGELSGDLDAVAARALEVDVDSRYGSVEAFAEDLRRFLRGEPVRARHQTFSYVAQRFIRRHRVPVAATTFFVLLCLTFGIVSTMLFFRAERSEAAALISETEALNKQKESERLTEFMEEMIGAADPDVSGRVVTQRTFLERGMELVPEAFAGEPLLRLRMFTRLGQMAEKSGLDDLASEAHSYALNEAERRYGGEHEEFARALGNLGAVDYGMERNHAAEVKFREALAIGERVGMNRDALLQMRSNLGSVLLRLGRFDEAETFYRRVLEARRELKDSKRLATSLMSMGALFYARGDLERAELWFLEALEIRAADNEDGLSTASTHDFLCRSIGPLDPLRARGHCRRGLEILRRSLPDEDRRIAKSRKSSAMLLLNEEPPQLDEAEELLLLALDVLRPSDSWHAAEAESLLGEIYALRGDCAAAMPLLERSLGRLNETRGPEHFVTRQADRRVTKYESSRHCGASAATK